MVQAPDPELRQLAVELNRGQAPDPLAVALAPVQQSESFSHGVRDVTSLSEAMPRERVSFGVVM